MSELKIMDYFLKNGMTEEVRSLANDIIISEDNLACAHFRFCTWEKYEFEVCVEPIDYDKITNNPKEFLGITVYPMVYSDSGQLCTNRDDADDYYRCEQGLNYSKNISWKN